ncbi:TetR/AcrR family transcriptional regulator [Streptomyces chilikensis]|uniref:TetR/AcrR family transcriptional regulator n=1 Tax=Streptomyces chilikensis TaxID=1194079 RepID=UPI0014089BCA|nr:TetR/AcrR family transcriptional regulator [Streptomyces chilikensis]
MKNQERSARTRASLVLAAARNFDRHGYDGTSLASICAEAGISIGALTFHFPNKAAVAATVVDEGIDALERIRAGRPDTGQYLQDLSDLVVQVAEALCRNVHVRAAARLVMEGHVSSDWPALWRSEIQQLLERASASGALSQKVRPDTAAHLVFRLMDGTATQVRGGSTAAAVDFRTVWRAALDGISAGH